MPRGANIQPVALGSSEKRGENFFLKNTDRKLKK